MTALPIVCKWDGESFTPVGRYAKEADAQFIIGKNYRMAEHQERSTATHNHEFAFIAEAWKSLPEKLSDQFASAEHLRKRCLIAAGFYNEIAVDAGSNAAAIRVAAGFRKQDEFAVCVIRGGVVAVRTAKSQSRRAMSAQEFQQSKSAVLDILSEMIGVKPDALERNAGRAA